MYFLFYGVYFFKIKVEYDELNKDGRCFVFEKKIIFVKLLLMVKRGKWYVGYFDEVFFFRKLYSYEISMVWIFIVWKNFCIGWNILY